MTCMNIGGPFDQTPADGASGAVEGSRYERYATALGEVMLGDALELLRCRDFWDMVRRANPAAR